MKAKCNHAGSRGDHAHISMMKSVQLTLATKYSPDKMKRVLVAATQTPAEAVLCLRAGISRTSLRYWLTLSKEGKSGDPFDIKIGDGRVERFHILFAEAIETGLDVIEHTLYELSTGTFRSVLDHHGIVQYKLDPFLVELGCKGEEAYLLDKNGEPVPYTKPIVDPETGRWFMSRRRPEIYGNKQVVEHEHRGGVLVLGATMTSEQLDKTFGGPQKIVDVEFEPIPNAVVVVPEPENKV
jgi:hypothetical protein